jgi:hypothetical protein
LNRLLVGQDGFLLLRLRQLDIGASFPGRKNGLRDRSGKCPQSSRGAEQAGKRRTLESHGCGQRNVGEISGPRHTDPGIGGDQCLLGLADIRAALEERGRKPGRNLRGMWLSCELHPARDRSRIISQQDAEEIFLLPDSPFQVSDFCRGRIYQLLRLANVED